MAELMATTVNLDLSELMMVKRIARKNCSSQSSVIRMAVKKMIATEGIDG